VSYAEAGVEQWVRQQNASRQKQQMAASSVYASQVYRSCDRIPEAGYHRYWSEHLKPGSSVDHARAHMSVDFVGATRYGSADSAMNLHCLCQENCRMPDNSLTLEQQQQRQNKIGRLQAIRRMLATDQQVPMPDEHMDSMTGAAGVMQSQVVPVGWNGVPCDDNRYASPYNSGSQVMSSGYGSSATGRQFHAPSCSMMTSVQRRWYHMQREQHMNQMGIQNNYCHCQQTDFCNSNVRYLSDACAPSQISNECCQFSVQGRGMPLQAMCDSAPAYHSCNPQACACEPRYGKRHTLPSDMYGYTDVGIQPNYGCHQRVNRSSEFINEKYCMPVDDSRQLTYGMSCKGQTDGIQNWNSGENVLRQRLLAAPFAQQFSVHKQQQLSNSSYGADQNVAQPVNTAVSCAPAQMPAVAVRQRQAGNSKRRKNNNNISAPSDAKSRKLDSVAGEWSLAVSAARSGTLVNITSASLAHLAEGVENISAVMQQSLEQGGPFHSVRQQSNHADGSNENGNFIPADCSLPVHTAGASNFVDEKAALACDRTSVNLSLPILQTASGNSRSSVTSDTSFPHVHSTASTTGIDIVVMPKAPYTISYHPTGISSAGDSVANADVGNTSASVSNQDAGMMQPSIVECHMSNVDSRRRISNSGGFSQLTDQQQSRITCHKMPADAAKVDEQAAAADTCLSMASSIAVIQPQMMSGTQLFIGDHCSESTPRLKNYGLPPGMSSRTFRSPQQSHSMQHGPSY